MSQDRVDLGGPADDREPQNTTASRLFDLRTIIGALFVLYGVILFIAGLFDSSAEIDKANGIRINLWLGLAMFLLGALFLLWVRLRPLHVSTGPSAAEQAGIVDEGPSAH
jgi:protein-S-isoprenylcysteine O-methyltransferase Ste14